ncbi:MAG: cupin domain-containing protein [Gemmataceae bacterium]
MGSQGRQPLESVCVDASAPEGVQGLTPWLPTAAPPGLRQTRSLDMAVDKVNLREKLARFADHWSPKVVGELNGQQVKLVKFRGEFVWHHHDHEDELFLVVAGRFCMEFRDRHVWLDEGEFLIVPRGVEHRPVADEEVHVLLFEPATTLNTGNVTDERTTATLDRI